LIYLYAIDLLIPLSALDIAVGLILV